MAYPRIRRHNFEIVEAVLPPAKQRVTFNIAHELEFGVKRERLRCPELIDLHGMVDHQFRRKQRIDFLGVAAELAHRLAHCRQVNDGRDAGEVLQQHARGQERNLFRGLCGRLPVRHGANIVRMHKLSVFLPQQIFEQDFHREWQARNSSSAGTLDGLETVDFKRFVANFKRGTCTERVLRKETHDARSTPLRNTL